MTEKENFQSSLDLSPGDQGWKPLPEPDFYKCPEAFKARWNELKTEEQSIEDPVRDTRALGPSFQLMRRPLGPSAPRPSFMDRKLRV